MKYYFAPFEGISWYLYRNLAAKHFEAADVYVTPFIAPNQMRSIRESDKKDILPENNRNLHIIPQLIGNRADEIVDTANQIYEMGYQEINLNFGCPSGRIGLLSSMFTNPNYRRKGIAKELLSRVVNEAKEYGCGTVQITASDMGVKLYTDFGFKHNDNFMHYKL